MEKNTVLLSVEDYNSLKEFKTEVELNGLVRLDWGTYKDWCYIGKHARDEIIDANKKLQEKIESLENPNKDKTIDDVAKMNFWQFRKWKRARANF